MPSIEKLDKEVMKKQESKYSKMKSIGRTQDRFCLVAFKIIGADWS